VSVLNSVRRQESRRDRHAARRILWRESSVKRVRRCANFATEKAGCVTVKATGTGLDRRAGFGGLAVCGSTWACPVCSAKIAAHRQAELAAAIDAWENVGGQVVLLTMTMRHKRGQRLKTLWDALSYAWGSVTSGAPWQDAKAAYGVAGYTRVVEVTHGENGWHVHVHALLFVRAEVAALWGQDVLDVGPVMFQRWREALIRKGMAAPVANSGGLDIRHATADTAKALGGYLAKSVYTANSAAWEVVGGQGKTAKRGNRTPFQILADAVALGDADDLDLWREWEQASQGRRQHTWSRGIRKQLRLADVESTDEEVAEADDLAGVVLAVIAPEAWRTGWRFRSAELLEAAEADDTGECLRVLLGEPPG
jgi:hypothetical protein